MMRNGQDAVAVFAAMIATLEEEAVDFDRRAAAARALIQQLRDHARVVAAVKVPPSQNQNPASRKPDAPKAAATRRQQAAKPAARTPPAPVESAAGTNVEELKKLAAEVARLNGLIKAEKNAATIKDHVAALLRAERRGGEILIKLGGSLKPLPMSQADRKRWRQAAARSPTAFDAKLKRDIATALARISSNATSAATVDKAKPPSRPPAPARPVKRPRPVSASQPPINKLSDWHQEADGSLTRTVTSVEDDVAAVPAGV